MILKMFLAKDASEKTLILLSEFPIISLISLPSLLNLKYSNEIKSVNLEPKGLI